MLQFNCPHCNGPFEVPESQAGEFADCPLCGQEVQIPRVEPHPSGTSQGLPPTTPSDLSRTLRTSGLAIASLVCGLIMCLPPTALAGVILGIVALTQIADPARRLTGRGLAIAGIVTGAIGCTLVPVALLIAILLPALSAARSTARQMQNSTQLRGIHQGAIFHAQGNNDYYPGLDRSGQLLDGTVEGRFLLLLQADYFSAEYLVSPSETKPYWTGGALDASMYSYSMLQIANPGERRAEWSASNNSEAVVFSDRAVDQPGGGIGSVHTSIDGPWKGSVVWNNNHVSFDRDYNLWTQYGNAPAGNDNIFDPAGDDDAYMIHSDVTMKVKGFGG
jgi:hypothetical protein